MTAISLEKLRVIDGRYVDGKSPYRQAFLVLTSVPLLVIEFLYVLAISASETHRLLADAAARTSTLTLSHHDGGVSGAGF
jgi:hypothetical protein